MTATNKCFFVGRVKEGFDIRVSSTKEGTQRLFLPILLRRYVGGDDKKYAYTSVPLVFYSKYAERAEKIIRPGMTLAVTARFDSNYSKEQDKEWITFVVEEFEIVGWPEDGNDFSDSSPVKAVQSSTFEETDDDDFPF